MNYQTCGLLALQCKVALLDPLARCIVLTSGGSRLEGWILRDGNSCKGSHHSIINFFNVFIWSSHR